MDIGVPRERRPFEFRVGLTPAFVTLLAEAGHTVYIEHQAGLGAGFSDDDFKQAGGRIVYSPDEAFGRAELVLKVAPPTVGEMDLLADGQTVMGILHLPSARIDKIETLLARRVTAVAYEQIQLADGTLPVLKPLSQICGRMIPQLAANLLQNDRGGKGILIGGAPGVPPAEVVIIGAGVVGSEAARIFLSQGAHVTLLDRDLAQLQRAEERLGGGMATLVATPFNVERVIRFADVVAAAVLVPGEKAPQVISRSMVRQMKPRTVLLDLSIDEGGCVETSRPTTHFEPTFLEEGVIHYCVPNVPGAVARTATHAFLNAAWPYIQKIAELGIGAAVEVDPALRRGTLTHDGRLLAPGLLPAGPAIGQEE